MLVFWKRWEIWHKDKYSKCSSDIIIIFRKSSSGQHLVNMWGFFLGRGFGGIFAIWSISSHKGVQIGLELVRFIALIGLNKVLDQRYIPDVSEEIFTHDISTIRRQKNFIFCVLKVFISNFTYTRRNDPWISRNKGTYIPTNIIRWRWK